MLGYIILLIALSLFSLGVPFAIWTFFDARKKNLSKWRILPVAVMWYVFLPIYIVRRNNYTLAPHLFLVLAIVVVTLVIATHNHLNRKHGVESTFFPSDSIPSQRFGRIIRDPSWDDWVLKDSHVLDITAHSMTYVSGHIGWRFLRWGVIRGDTDRGWTYDWGVPSGWGPYLDPLNPTPGMIVGWLLILSGFSAMALSSRKTRELSQVTELDEEAKQASTPDT